MDDNFALIISLLLDGYKYKVASVGRLIMKSLYVEMEEEEAAVTMPVQPAENNGAARNTHDSLSTSGSANHRGQLMNQDQSG